MPLPILANLPTKYYHAATEYYLHIIAFITSIVVINTISQGRKTNRERDLHGRVIILTGGFTSTGLTLMEALCQRGAHIIALTKDPIDAPQVELVVDALRETTNNTQIFAEQCDILSAPSVREFCTKFLTGNEHRVDAIIFTHEYEHIGPVFASAAEKQACEDRRAAASDGTFLMTTLLLPVLLVAPPERDIRIINVVNPYYAAAIPFFPNPPPARAGSFAREGYRALRTIILSRHLQRVFDAMPSAPAPNPDAAGAALSSNKAQKSNIVAVSVTPGFSRQNTIGPFLRSENASPEFSLLGFFTYLLLLPLLRIFAKTPTSAVQSILHVLFLPTPFKRAQMVVDDDSRKKDDDDLPEEVLKPGALYRDCAVIRLNVRKPDIQPEEKETGKRLIDDGEYGGEVLGRLVWENFEASLKHREKSSGSDEVAPGSEKKQQ